MKLQDDTHYLTRSLDVRYVVEDKVSSNFWSKHSLYNPRNINNTEEISGYGTTYSFSPSKDIDPKHGICTTRSDEDFILLQNFEFVNYYVDQLISTVYRGDNNFTFLSDKDSKQGCIRVKGNNLNIYEFPIIAIFYDDNETIKNKLSNLYGCLRWI